MKNLLKQLISIDSTSNETQLAKFIENYIKSLNLPNLEIEKQYIGDNNRYNLIIKNTGNPEILLAGHMDTVPVFNKKQLEPKEIDGKIYGRGAVDMKGGLTIILDLLPEFLKNDKKFWLLFYCDEEYYFKGMMAFIKYLEKSNINPKKIIIPEPTDEKVVLNFRGITEFELKIRGISSHSARKHFGISAIDGMYKFVDELERFFNSKEGVFESSVNLAGINGGLLNDNEIIWRGNQVPDYTHAMIEVRIGSSISQKEFENFVKNWFEEGKYKLEEFKVNFYLDGLLQSGIKGKYKNIAEIDEGRNFGYSDIAMIKKALPKSDCLLLGPGPKSKAHQKDEYVVIDSLYKTKNKIRNVLQID